MPFVKELRCVSCGRTYPPDTPYTCAACGDEGILDVVYEYAAIGKRLTRNALAARERTLWRYRELLPIGEETTLPALSVGWTPVISAPGLAQHVGLETLYLKDDGRNPTGSLKDRASAIAAVRARDQGCRIVACASTGNAASSLAGMAASTGLQSVIFVPWETPEPKLTQLLVFGATVLRVQGSYFDAYQLCQSFCERGGWYNRNCAVNPWLVEGKKTAGLEICEQMGWQAPAWVAVSVGDGCTLAGIWKGFRELHALGLIDRTPRMLGIQARGAAPLVHAFREGRAPAAMTPVTVADSIKVGVPRNWRKLLTAIAESNGCMVDVEDDDILDAIGYTGRLAGVFAEPAASAAIAGLRRAVQEGIVGRTESAVAMITGNGLKDTGSARSAVQKPFEIAPDGSKLEEILRGRGLIA